MKYTIKYRIFKDRKFTSVLEYTTFAQSEREAVGNFHEVMDDSDDYYEILNIKKARMKL